MKTLNLLEMFWRPISVAVLSMCASGCGGAGDDTGTTTGASASSSSSSGGATPMEFTFTQPDIEVLPGEEWTWCYRYPIPPEHKQPGKMYITGYESFFGKGTHHYFSYYNGDPKPETKVTEPTPCFDDGPRGAVVDIRSLNLKTGPGPTFGAQEDMGGYMLPPGYAYELVSTDGYFVTDHHLFNTTPDPLMVPGWMTFRYAPPDTITHVINMVTCTMDRPTIQIAPNSSLTINGTCVATSAIDIQVLASHAHMYLKRFRQYFYDGTQTLPDPIYESTDWDSPKIQVLDQPLHLEPGQGFTIQCEYENNTPNLIEEGIGETGEMCVAMNLYTRTANPRDTPTAGGKVLVSGGKADIAEGGVCGPFGALPCWK